MGSPTELWEHLFGNRDGLLCLTTAQRQPDGRLGRMRDLFFPWPAAALAAESFALGAAAKGLEVFFVATLLRHESRKKDAALPVGALFVDGDRPGSQVPRDLPAPTAVVASSPGKHHWYWRLPEPVSPEQAEDLNRRLAYAIGADPSGWDVTQLLRVPGTRNHKYQGNPRVELEHLDDGGHIPLEVFQALPAVPNRQVDPSTILGAGDTPPVRLDPAGMAVWRGERPCRGPAGQVDRSKTLTRIAYTLHAAGATPAAIAAALAERDLALGYRKYTDRADAAFRYAEIAARAAASGDPAPAPDPAATQAHFRAYRFLTAAELLGAAEPELAPLVHGLLYRGLITTISSWAGVGKTTTVFEVLLALHTRRLALGRLPTYPLAGPVVYFNEMPTAGLRRKIVAHCQAHGVDPAALLESVRFITISGEPVLSPAASQEFRDACAGAALVVIDTFDVWMGGDANSVRDVAQSFNLLRELADAGTAVLVLDHQGKPPAMGGNKLVTAIAGSSAKQRWSDLVYRLDRRQAESLHSATVLDPVKDRYGDLALKLELMMTEDDRLAASVKA